MVSRTQPLVSRNIRRAAFTLMEMLVVVAIIVILAGLGSYYVIGQLNEAKITQTKIKAKNISKAIDNYYVDNGVYPPDLESLLVQTPTGHGPYLTNREDIFDFRGQPFLIDPNGTRNAAAGATVKIPDVYVVIEGRGEIGNFSK
jgi:general secretion pathway protein G